jgi:predicted house-cleaning noncanonical NTP pyrophosphatase (MazG superfamily)
MDQNSLRELAAKLHEQLSEALRADPKSRERLSDMMRDINRLIDAPAGAPSAAQHSLPDRLERIAVQFDADHPPLAASARRLIDLLGEVGI